MKVGIIGCGNVGFNTLKAFYKKDLTVIGYDTDKKIQQKLLNEFGKESVADGLIELISCTAVFVCVPTEPSVDSSKCDLSIFESIVKQFSLLENHKDYQCKVFVQRSTCPPKTANRYLTYFKKTNYVVNPSFLAKHTQWEDSINPVRIVYSGNQSAIQIMDAIYNNFNDTPKCSEMSHEAVELLKYVENSVDAVLISLWNEYLQISDSLNITRENFGVLIEILLQRPRFGTTFRVPGKAFGLWCLPKDIAALSYWAEENSIEVPVLNGAIKTNLIANTKYGVGSIPTTELFSVKKGVINIKEKGIEVMLGD